MLPGLKAAIERDAKKRKELINSLKEWRQPRETEMTEEEKAAFEIVFAAIEGW